ncbi:hypothetical protein [Kribbella sp. CA-293567]|uniref:hypothetical protein n=1 Tax=Kribbella sp. CA-293567 TaxID=3002436 RepID=UPI0022DDD56D|nr:hypothetical protein [Kribbella sp. CA-293567]WBQ03188.1 hypothetical protein OX958_24780 [Kribbella sp. CA-293567]
MLITQRIIERMFPLELDNYDARQTLAAAAEVHAFQAQAEVAELRLALHFGDLHPDPAIVRGELTNPGGERGIVYGGAGCPAVAEFAVAEFGVVTGRSMGAAASFLGQCLALRHRLPLTYAQVLSGHATAWKARMVAKACLELSQDAAAIVDKRVASIVDSVTPLRLANIVRAAMWQADPEAAQAAAEARAKKRGVWAGRTDDHGTTMLFVRGATGDVLRIMATIGQIADALAALGDTDSLDQRRAKAIGVIADPALADKLLQVANHLTNSPDAAHQPDAADAPGTPDSSASGDTAGQPGSASKLTSPSAAAPGGADSPNASPAAATLSELPSPSQPCPSQPSPTRAPSHTWCSDDRAWDRSAADSAAIADHELDEPDFDDSPHPSDPAADDCFADPGPSPDFWQPPGQSDEAHDDTDHGMDAAARRELSRKLNAIQQLAYTGRKRRRTVLYAHITDEVLLAGHGVARVEGYGPVYAKRLAELLGHDQVVIQPVIDLNNAVSVDAYEIPRRIREQVKLTYPVEQFPYGTAATTDGIDLDHIEPFDPNGPPKQTSTTNLAPLRRFSHRVKTHGAWKVQRVDDQVQEWTTRHGFRFRVDQTGTHRLDDGS